MAKFFPGKFPHPHDPKKKAEGDTFAALKELDDDWMVFYEVRWQSKRFGKEGDGETDFVLAHPNRGLIILEVKGGREIRQEDGKWVQVGHDGQSHVMGTNPFQQGELAKYALKKYLREKVAKFPEKGRIGHAAAFPGFRLDGDLGIDAPRAIIIDKDDHKAIVPAVERIAKHWSPLQSFDSSQFKQLKQALAPSRSIKRHRTDDVEDVKDQLIELTERQYEILRRLSGRQHRSLVVGGAGTGKTVLARQRAADLAADGFRVLLVCFNRPLGDYLESEFTVPIEPAVEGGDVGEVMAGSFHAICRRIADAAGKLPPGEVDQAWWDEKLPSVVAEAAEQVGERFDAVIVDEGQDFRPEWFTALQLLLDEPDEGFFYVFADANQDIYRKDWESPIDGAPYPLFENCRNTVQIAERVGLALGTDEKPLGHEGPKPSWGPAETNEQIGKKLTLILDNLLNKEGLSPEQVAVLATKKSIVDGLRGGEAAGWDLGDESDADTVLVETVHRFKGLERDAIVLILPELTSQEDRNLAYVGMSRPMVLLFLIGPESVREELGWT